ncbi:hypothetical protein AG1IA_05913 [Rhizoctonia solani AG-1 IA]|uniref:Uncharacterized protein n=1 Tax=Thanatephorus cucumeris (strain AG1-IA) TaxID=983506 RepID=L8WTG3_THACA|nr:hypothetical protein AG1IA_05913 [Rhizoctonia solani AG-1 IA]
MNRGMSRRIVVFKEDGVGRMIDFGRHRTRISDARFACYTQHDLSMISGVNAFVVESLLGRNVGEGSRGDAPAIYLPSARDPLLNCTNSTEFYHHESPGDSWFIILSTLLGQLWADSERPYHVTVEISTVRDTLSDPTARPEVRRLGAHMIVLGVLRVENGHTRIEAQ